MLTVVVVAGVAYANRITGVVVANVAGGQTTIHPRAVFNRDVIDIRTGKTVHLVMDDRPVLLILLSGTECPLCLDESSIWESLAKERPEALRVVGLFVGTTSADIRAFLRTQKTGYELYDLPDAGEFALAYERPLKVLLDRWGRVRAAWGPSNSRLGHEDFRRDIINTLGLADSRFSTLPTSKAAN
jgi:thiol-disulfide isomerase/thioredoxin